jgi:hypothetical protein
MKISLDSAFGAQTDGQLPVRLKALNKVSMGNLILDSHGMTALRNTLRFEIGDPTYGSWLGCGLLYAWK